MITFCLITVKKLKLNFISIFQSRLECCIIRSINDSKFPLVYKSLTVSNKFSFVTGKDAVLFIED